MARKTTATLAATTKAVKKATPSSVPAVKASPEVSKEEVGKEASSKGRKASKGRSATGSPLNLEEEIRRRAYELYLERRATAGSSMGNEAQDWLIAEREVRSRINDSGQHTA